MQTIKQYILCGKPMWQLLPCNPCKTASFGVINDQCGILWAVNLSSFHLESLLSVWQMENCTSPSTITFNFKHCIVYRNMLRFMDHTCLDLNIGIRLKLDPSSVQALALSALSAVSSEGGSRQPSWPSPSLLTWLSGPSSRFSSSSSSWNAWHAVKLCFGQTTDNKI